MTRTIDKPTDIPRSGWTATARRVGREIGRDRISLVSAGVAFFGLLALFPGIAALVAVAGLVMDPQTVVAQLEQASGMLPSQAADILTRQAEDVAASGGTTLGLAAIGGLLVTIYSASKGIASLIEGMNVAWGEDETRGFLRLKALTLLLTLFVIVGLVLGLLASVAVPAALSFMALGPIWDAAITAVTYAVLLGLTILGLAVLYRFGPDRDQPGWRWLTPGAAVAAVAWAVGTALFAWYVTSFGSYNATFGSLGGVIVLLTWLWLSSFVVLLGAEIDSELEREAEAHRHGD